jgi:hypothetical protein
LNGKSASTVLTLVEAPAETTCPAFCLRHDPLAEELCIGPVIELNFGEQAQDIVRYVRIPAYSTPDGGHTLSLITDHSNMTPAQARQIGTALIQAADATEAGAR